MKKIIAILTIFTLIFSTPITTDASCPNINQPYENNAIAEKNDKLVIEYEITEINPNARASTKTVVKTATCKYENKTVAVVKLTATFSYNGSTASCTSASSTYTMYDGWSYSNRSTNYGGNMATTSAKMEKGKLYVNFSTAMVCSKTGVVS